MLLFTSLCFSDPSGLNRFSLSSLLLSHRSIISAVTQGFFFWWCLPRISLAVSITAVLKVVIIESRSVSSLSIMVRGANFPLITAWKVSNTLGSFSFSRSDLSLVYFCLLILFRRRWKVIISKSWSLPVSAPGKLCVLAMFTPDWKCFLTRIWSSWLWLCQVHLLDALWWPKVSTNKRSLKVANSRSLEFPLICVISAEGSTNALPCQFPQASLPTYAFQSPCTTRCPSSVSDQWHSVAGHRSLLFHCHHSLTLGCTLLLLWCWKGLPSGG